MYVYDEANNLAKAIKDSKEYEEFKKAKDSLNSDAEMKKKVEEFEKIRYDVQMMSFKGEQDEEKQKKLQEMYQILTNDQKIKDYFDIEIRFNIMLADVNKIISESVKDLL